MDDPAATGTHLLVTAGRRLAEWGLVIGSAGNLSLRLDTHLVVVSASGTRLDEFSADECSVIDLDGKVVAGHPVPTSETPLHLAIYAATPARAIAHTHAASSVAVSCVEDELPALHYSCLQLGGPVPVAPYATYGSSELASSVVGALGEDRFGALMASHGSIAYGVGDPASALNQACERLRVLEWLCDVHLRAHALGRPHALSPAELGDVRATTARMRAAHAAASALPSMPGTGEVR